MPKYNAKYIANGVSFSGKAEAPDEAGVRTALSNAVVSTQAERKPRKAKTVVAETAAAPATKAGK